MSESGKSLANTSSWGCVPLHRSLRILSVVDFLEHNRSTLGDRIRSTDSIQKSFRVENAPGVTNKIRLMGASLPQRSDQSPTSPTISICLT